MTRGGRTPATQRAREASARPGIALMLMGITHNCLNCGEQFTAFPSQKRKLCSNQCRLEWLHNHNRTARRTGQLAKCATCGNEFYVPAWRKKSGRGIYCSRECYSISKQKAMRGTLNPQFIDGRVKRLGLKAFYRSGVWRRLRRAIYQRDNYNCKKCRRHGGNLHAHHIIPLGKHDPLDEDNIITVCIDCHGLIHNGGVT